MNRAVIAGLCAVAIMAGSAMAAEMSHRKPMHKGVHHTGMHHTTGQSGTVGSSNRGIPGSMNAGGSSPASPNTVQPGLSNIAPGNGAQTR